MLYESQCRHTFMTIINCSAVATNLFILFCYFFSASKSEPCIAVIHIKSFVHVTVSVLKIFTSISANCLNSINEKKKIIFAQRHFKYSLHRKCTFSVCLKFCSKSIVNRVCVCVDCISMFFVLVYIDYWAI